MNKKKTLKIAQVSPVLLKNGGGTGQACYQLAKALTTFDDIETEIFLPETQKQTKKIEEEIKINYIKPICWRGNFAYVPELADKLENFDLIHLHYPFYGGAEFVLAASKKYNIPYVITFHTETIFSNLFYNILLKIYNLVYLSKIIKRASCVVGVTKHHLMHSSLSPYLGFTKSAIIPNGVSKIFITKAAREVEKKETKMKIGFCAFLDKAHYYKGLDALMRAICDTKHELIICGGGNMLNHYRELARNLSISDQCKFLGTLYDDDLVEFYDSIHVLVSPSEIAESFSIVNLEALSRGKPILTAKWPATEELSRLFPQDYYYFVKRVNPRELKKMISFIDNHFPKKNKKIKSIIENNFDWQMIAKEVIKEYKNVVF